MSRIGLITFLLSLAYISVAQQVTYYEHVAPIIADNCLQCHRRGDVAPFPLETYKDIASKAKLIKFVVETKYMPPWIADPNYRHYENERILTNNEIKIIQDWVNQGKLAGDKSKMPKVSGYARNSLIKKKPDMVLSMSEPIFLPGDNKEHYIAVKIPFEIPESKDIEAIEFIPGNRKLVHHMNFAIHEKGSNDCVYAGTKVIDRTETNKSKEDTYGEFGLLDVDGTVSKMVYYGGWVPGMSPQVFDDEFGIKLPKRGILIFDVMHYAATPVDDHDLSKVYLYFKNQPVERSVSMITLGSGSLNAEDITPPLVIPPNTIKTFKLQVGLGRNMSVLYLMAHMHLIGKSFLAYAITPDAKRIPLLKIDDWDFDWQEMYKLNPMIHLPKGTIVYIEATYDNTVNNPRNPFNPPRTIYSTDNMKTTDEMMNLILLAVEYKPGDEYR